MGRLAALRAGRRVRFSHWMGSFPWAIPDVCNIDNGVLSHMDEMEPSPW